MNLSIILPLLLAGLNNANAFAPFGPSSKRSKIKKTSRSYIDERYSGSSPRSSLFHPIEAPKVTVKSRSKPSSSSNGTIIHKKSQTSAKDWLHSVSSIPKSTILAEIKNPVMTAFAWSTVVAVSHKLMSNSSSMFLKNIAVNMCIPTQIHSFLMSSLGLLLVFRTNSAYQRFVEGRKIWEEILSISRNLSRMLSLYEGDVGDERISRIKKTLAAFPYLLRHHVRAHCLDCNDDVPMKHRYEFPQPVETGFEAEEIHAGASYDQDTIDGPGPMESHYCVVDRRALPWSLLSNRALEKCARAVNRPLWSCDRMASEIVSVPYSDTFTSRERLSMLGQIEKLSNAIGQCERIHQTAVPRNYARHALRSLSIWLLTLPFALVKDCGLLAGPVVGITAWLMFGIYQIGHSIEDPFQKTLRLSILCNAIRRDVLGDTVYRASAFSLDDCTSSNVTVSTTEESDKSLSSPSFKTPTAEELVRNILPEVTIIPKQRVACI